MKPVRKLSSLTPQDIADFAESAATGATINDIADMHGVSSSSLRACLEEGSGPTAVDPFASLAREFKKARARARINVLSKLRDSPDLRHNEKWLDKTAKEYSDAPNAGGVSSVPTVIIDIRPVAVQDTTSARDDLTIEAPEASYRVLEEGSDGAGDQE